jgi:phage tail P2-like protein
MPPGMAEEPKITAECAALDAAHNFIIQAIQSVSILSEVDRQDDSVTDMLALQQHVDYYNQALPLETRRSLVKNSGHIHKIKGTPAAVEEVARIVFGSATVQEWFEYGGKPFCFRVLINEFPNSDEQMDEVHRAIASAQNARSHLDDVIIIASTATATAYLAGVVQMSVNFTLTQDKA